MTGSGPPSWARKALRTMLGTPHGDEVAEALRAARRTRVGGGDDGGPARHLWYLGELLRPDTFRLAWALRRRRRGGRAPGRASAGRVGAGLGGDVRAALRSVRRGTLPAFACLAVAVGAAGATFSVVHEVLLRPLPFPDGERLAQAGWVDEDGVRRPLSWAELEALRETPGVAGAEAYMLRSLTLVGPSGAVRVAGASVTPGLLPLLGVEPDVGRGFADDEGAEPGFSEVVVLGHALARAQFGEGGAVGGTLTVNERPMTVVGVLPPGVAFPAGQELWLPLGTRDRTDARRRYLTTVVRTSGAGPAAEGPAADAAKAALEDLRGRAPAGSLEGAAPDLRPLRDAFVPASVRRLLPVLLGGVVLVLAVAGANVAGLLFTRALDRTGDWAVRAALGAGRVHIVRLVALEGVALAAAAGAAGVALAAAWVAVLEARLPPGLPYWVDLGLRWPAVAVVLCAGAVVALLAAAAPAVRLLRDNPTCAAPGRESRGATRRAGGGLRRALVSGQVALGFLLVVAATLLGRSFSALADAGLGFDDRAISTFRVALSGDAYDETPARLDFAAATIRALEASPGVTGAVATTSIPGADGGWIREVSTGAEGPDGETVPAAVVGSSAAFFATLGVRPVRGRAFHPSEAADPEAAVALVSEALARRLWPGASPLGRAIHLRDVGELTVVGVVPPLRYGDLGAGEGPTLQVHLPLSRTAFRALAFLAAAPGGPLGEAGARRAVEAADPGQAPYDVATMAARREASTAHPRFLAGVLAGFGALATLLALAGLYGAVSYDVARRRREIGIRLALGASRARVGSAVVLRGAVLTAAGVAAGAGVALLAAPALRAAVYGVTPLGAGTLLAVGAVTTLLGTVATAATAARAARTDPAGVMDRA